MPADGKSSDPLWTRDIRANGPDIAPPWTRDVTQADRMRQHYILDSRRRVRRAEMVAPHLGLAMSRLLTEDDSHPPWTRDAELEVKTR